MSEESNKQDNKRWCPTCKLVIDITSENYAVIDIKTREIICRDCGTVLGKLPPPPSKINWGYWHTGGERKSEERELKRELF
ncbi:hypothetical protein BEH94_05715 [Candidatus Altiarchaeales archaeon WOR_SM1_SCG]|nr:hypothetical protein BEH94_05715 [Candidatus Altiarchaeales archaeon WOR_SM1_SCG]ODS37689.1 MAG: hypothetical protein A7315_00015 [Candidatus Altiarchaeales archaeon WOR_SM1_79]